MAVGDDKVRDNTCWCSIEKVNQMGHELVHVCQKENQKNWEKITGGEKHDLPGILQILDVIDDDIRNNKEVLHNKGVEGLRTQNKEQQSKWFGTYTNPYFFKYNCNNDTIFFINIKKLLKTWISITNTKEEKTIDEEEKKIDEEEGNMALFTLGLINKDNQSMRLWNPMAERLWRNDEIIQIYQIIEEDHKKLEKILEKKKEKEKLFGKREEEQIAVNKIIEQTGINPKYKDIVTAYTKYEKMKSETINAIKERYKDNSNILSDIGTVAWLVTYIGFDDKYLIPLTILYRMTYAIGNIYKIHKDLNSRDSKTRIDARKNLLRKALYSIIQIGLAFFIDTSIYDKIDEYLGDIIKSENILPDLEKDYSNEAIFNLIDTNLSFTNKVPERARDCFKTILKVFYHHQIKYYIEGIKKSDYTPPFI